MTIDVQAGKLPRRDPDEGGPFVVALANLARSVATWPHDDFAQELYDDWKRGARDVVEDRCESPSATKLKLGARPVFATAVGTDPETDVRQRRDWYVRSDSREESTYVVLIRCGPGLVDRERLALRGRELVESLREIRARVTLDD